MTENIKEIESEFLGLVERIADEIDRGSADVFEENSFKKFRPYIVNWETLLAAIEEENEEGYSELWDEIKFAPPEG